MLIAFLCDSLPGVAIAAIIYLRHSRLPKAPGGLQGGLKGAHLHTALVLRLFCQNVSIYRKITLVVVPLSILSRLEVKILSFSKIGKYLMRQFQVKNIRTK